MPAGSLRVSSPDGRIEVVFGLLDSVPCYSINRDGVGVILPSRLGFTFLSDAPLNAGLSVVDWEETSFDETWTQPWGEVKNIRDHHNELRVRLTEGGARAAPREMVIVFRAFDDGVGFRYELPEQPHLGKFEIMDEQTEFAMSGDHQSWWIPALEPAMSQYLYRKEPLRTLGRGDYLNTPLTMETAQGLYLSIHEAALMDYSSMTLRPEDNLVLKVALVPWSDGVLVKGRAPLKKPWRTIQIAERPGDLISSYLILNLNEPNVLGDVSWVKPRKYIGIRWGMHIGKWSWASGPKHGATTENMKA